MPLEIQNITEMNIEDYIIFRVNALLHAHPSTGSGAKIVKRLEGGMSNYTYVVECEGKKYTYRVPGKFAEKFVDRVEEWENIQEVNRLGLNNITEYVEIRSGEKLAEYVEGTIMSTTDVVSYNAMSVAALKKIHNSDLKFRDYNAFGRLDADQNYCLETGYVFPQEYLDLRKKLDAIRATQAHQPRHQRRQTVCLGLGVCRHERPVLRHCLLRQRWLRQSFGLAERICRTRA